MSELKAFTFGLGQYTEDGSPCVVAFDGEKNPRLASDEKFYLKSEADKVIAELKQRLALAHQTLQLNQPEALYSDLETMARLSHEKDVVAREAAEQKAKANKLHSCLKCLVMRDLIKDCPEKKSAIEIVKEAKDYL